MIKDNTFDFLEASVQLRRPRVTRTVTSAKNNKRSFQRKTNKLDKDSNVNSHFDSSSSNKNKNTRSSSSRGRKRIRKSRFEERRNRKKRQPGSRQKPGSNFKKPQRGIIAKTQKKPKSVEDLKDSLTRKRPNQRLIRKTSSVKSNLSRSLGRGLGVAGQIISAWELGTGIGGVILGGVDPDKKNPYKDIPGFGAAEIGWELGAGIALGIKDLLNPKDEITPKPSLLPDEEIDESPVREASVNTINEFGLNEFISTIPNIEDGWEKIDWPWPKPSNSLPGINLPSFSTWRDYTIEWQSVEESWSQRFWSKDKNSWESITDEFTRKETFTWGARARASYPGGPGINAGKGIFAVRIKNLTRIEVETVTDYQYSQTGHLKEARILLVFVADDVRTAYWANAGYWVWNEPGFSQTTTNFPGITKNNYSRKYKILFHYIKDEFLFRAPPKSGGGYTSWKKKKLNIGVGLKIDSPPKPIYPIPESDLIKENQEDFKMSVKCKAMDALKALEERLAALESELEIANIKLGQNAIESITYTDSNDNEIELPLDGIGGTTAKILENQYTQELKFEGIEEIKERLGEPIASNTELPSGETLAAAGIASAGIAGLGLLAQKKLGPQLNTLSGFGGIGNLATEVASDGVSGGINKINNDLQQTKEDDAKRDKLQLKSNLIDLLNLALNVHNAFSLSNAILQTALSAINNAVNFLGIKDKDGQPVDVGELIGDTFENILIAIIGTEATTNLQTFWLQTNRIVQSGANVLYSIQDLTNSAQSIAQQTGEYVAKIGNALRRNRIVPDDPEDSYEYMDENITAVSGLNKRLQAFEDGLSEVGETVGSLESITGEILSASEQFTQLQSNVSEFKGLISEKEAQKTIAENEDTESSQSVEIDLDSVITNNA